MNLFWGTFWHIFDRLEILKTHILVSKKLSYSALLFHALIILLFLRWRKLGQGRPNMHENCWMFKLVDFKLGIVAFDVVFVTFVEYMMAVIYFSWPFQAHVDCYLKAFFDINFAEGTRTERIFFFCIFLVLHRRY